VKHDEEVRLLEQLLHQIDTGTNLDAGAVLRCPTSIYTCPERAALERERFFAARPQMIGMSGDLPEPGSFLTRNDWGVELLATRDDQGRFRAFLNACRHRGNKVETAERGQRNHFVCRFHAWTYSSEGALVALPKPDHFGAVDRSCYGLIELPAVEAHGVLLVHPQRDGVIDPVRVLEGLGPDFDGFGFDQYVHVASDVYDMPINWKLAVDTFGETYHFSSLHRNSLYTAFHGDVQGLDRWEHNHRMVLCTREIEAMRHRPENEWSIRVGGFLVYWMFPNVLFNVGREWVAVVRVCPHAEEAGRSISYVDFYFDPLALADPASDADPRALFETFAAIIRNQDYRAAEMAQRSAESGLQEWFLFGRNEPTLHHYHATYQRELGLPPLAAISEASG